MVLDSKETPRLSSRTVPEISSDRDDRKEGGMNVRISLEVIEERTTKKQKKETNGPTWTRKSGMKGRRQRDGMRGERGCGRRIKTG